MIKRFRELFERYERRASALAIVCGLLIDTFTLHRIDLYLTNILLVFYLVLAAFSIALLNLHEAGRARWVSEGLHFSLLVAIQFALGGLFGRFLVYYARSGELFASWPFLLILAVLLVGNEFARKYYTLFVLQISLLFLAVFSFLIFFVPILLGKMGAMVFLLSGLLSLAVIVLFVAALRFFIPLRVNANLTALIVCVGSVFFFVNFLYYTNIIPPIPLSLSSAGVYHSLVRTPMGYQGSTEKKSWRDLFSFYDQVHLRPGSSLYAYSAVFAPTDFGTSVVHVWQHYDEKKDAWVDVGRVAFGIVGGRDGGYRGHSIKSNITPGWWRVNIQTLDGQIIGRIRFRVQKIEVAPKLIIESL
jgi:hypothetical protein